MSTQVSIHIAVPRPLFQSVMHLRQRFFRWSLILSFLLLLLTGCGHYSMQEVRLAFEGGKLEDALAHLDKGNSGKARLPYLFERGLIAHYANRFEESNQVFDIAENTA